MSCSNISRYIALIGYFGLLCLIPIWYLWLFPSTQLPVYLPIAFLLTPLLFPLVGLVRGKPYTYMWSSYLSLLYFAHGIGEAYTFPAERLLGLLEIALSLMFFIGSIYYVRCKNSDT